VSTLASCGRLWAIVPDLANRPRQLIFLMPTDSQLNDSLNEIHQIARFELSIVSASTKISTCMPKRKFIAPR
jgi:hypothetical protein